jgi:hypothetical protein
VTREKKVDVKAGQTGMVSFRDDRGEGIRPATAPSPLGPAPAEGERRFEGRVTQVTGDEVTVADRAGGSPRTFRVGLATQVLIDGQKSDFSALKPGMEVTVTPEEGTSGSIRRVEATTR